MDFAKNKTSILAIIALIVVCGGSFLGVRLMRNSVETETTAPSTYIVIATEPTTAATTVQTTEATMPTVITSEPTTVQSVITTFAVSTTEATTESTTEVTIPSTTAPTTQTTTKATTLPTTTKAASASSGAASTYNAAIFDEGLAGYQFSSDGNYYYTSSDPWQRAIGYNEVFDTLGAFAIFYLDTMRCKFTYEGKDWMIQFWKGQYGMIFIGTEIGVYTKDPSREVEHYDAASNEDALWMSCTAYRDGEEIYTRDYAKYWWCTGFVPGRLDKMTDRSEITLDSRITMKDYNMLLLFCSALKENGLVLGEDFKTKGLDVYITW